MEDSSKIQFNENSDRKVKTKKQPLLKYILNIFCFLPIHFSYDKILNKSIKLDINSKNDKEKENKKLKNIRNTGIDMARLVSMYTIVLFHYLFFGKASKMFPQYKRKITFITSFITWHNGAFILISGIVGYKSYKYSNLLYLWFTVLFYKVLIRNFTLYFKKGFVIRDPIYKNYYPIIFNRYWYFTTYFGMYLFLPLINKGIDYSSKYEFRLVVLTTLFIFVFWNEYKNPNEDIFHMNKGCSIVWFLTFYLTGAYIGKYRVDYNGFKKYIYCFTNLVIFAFVSYLYFKVLNNEFYFTIGNLEIKLPITLKIMINEKLNSFVKSIQSITICLFFMQIHYNKYISKIITFIGPLVFGIYLIHMDNIIKDNIIMHIFDNLPKNILFNSLISMLLLKSFKMCIFCLAFDYLRYLLFSFLRLKKILILIEIKMKQKLS